MQKPKVVLDNEVYRKIMYWVKKSKYEVSGLGTVVWDEKEQAFRVKSAMLLPQKNTTTHTEIDTKAVVKAMYELRDAEGDLRFWWHSHANMKVFWSSEDMETIRDFGSGGWVVATVFNHNYETRSAFYGVGGLIPNFVDDLETVVIPFLEPKAKEWDEEYTKNVTNVVFTPPSAKPLGPGTYALKGGELVKVNSPATSGTTTTGGSQTGSTPTTTTGSIKAEDFAKVEPPKNRPAGMPKREYKRWKREWRAAQENKASMQNDLEIAAERAEILPPEEGEERFQFRDFICYATGLAITLDDFVDPYPFTQDELHLMAMEGIHHDDLDYLLANGFDRTEILKCIFERGYGIDDFHADLETMKYNELDDPEWEDDIPVADRARMVH